MYRHSYGDTLTHICKYAYIYIYIYIYVCMHTYISYIRTRYTGAKANFTKPKSSPQKIIQDSNNN